MTRNDIPQPRPYDDDPLSHDAAFLALNDQQPHLPEPQCSDTFGPQPEQRLSAEQYLSHVREWTLSEESQRWYENVCRRSKGDDGKFLERFPTFAHWATLRMTQAMLGEQIGVSSFPLLAQFAASQAALAEAEAWVQTWANAPSESSGDYGAGLRAAATQLNRALAKAQAQGQRAGG